MPRINVRLDEELHKQVKIACAVNGKTIIDFVNEALVEELGEDKS